MSTKQILAPVVVKTPTDIGNAAFDGVRRRPVVAINDEGNLVVCCRRTAAKNGWEIEGTLFRRDRKSTKSVDDILA